VTSAASVASAAAALSASRLLTNAKVCSRIRELQETLSAATIALEISDRNARVAALQKRWDRLCAGFGLVLDKRGAEMADLPGGASGLLVRSYKGKEADRLVTRIDPGVISLVAELRGHERQAAEELGQWKTIHEERKTVDARLLYRAARVVTSAEASSRCRATALTSSNGKSPLPWTDTVDGARPAALLPGLLLERSFLLRALFLL